MIDGNWQRQVLSQSKPVSVGPDWQSRKDRMLARIRTCPDLPTLPIIALRVIEKASNPNCDADDLCRLISQDPSLCGKILRTVNSVMYSLRQPVSSLLSAIRVLGFDPLRSLVLSLSLSRVRQPPLSREMLQSYWRVSVAGGVAAWRVAMLTGRPSPDTDMVSALLRDLGMLVLHQLCPQEYPTILGASPVILSAFQCDLEDETLQINHAEAGAELLRVWRLPDDMIEPVRTHHDWTKAEQAPAKYRDRAKLLYFATQIGQMQLTADRPMLVREVLTLASSLYNLDETELRELLQWVQNQMEEFATILDVDLGEVLDYSDVLNRGVEELTRLTVQGCRPTPAPEAQPAPKPAGPGVAVPGLQARANQPTLAPEAERLMRGAEVNEAPTKTPGVPSHEEIHQRLFQAPRRPGTLGVLDGYEIIDLIGNGGMGSVFRAVDMQLKRTVAIKTLLPELVDNSAAILKFIQEGRAIAALTHENIVRVYAVGESAGIPYLVMEFIEGRTLTDRLLAEAPLPLAEIIRIGLQTASGLSAAHAHGLVHRDIKPANLLLENPTGRVKILDFGLAQVAAEAALARGQGIEGTPHFMSPEQAQGEPTDHRSDMFSLGCVLYTACTAQLPFDGDDVDEVLKAICACQASPIREINPDMPAWLEEVLIGLLTRTPSRRFPTAAEMKRLFLSRWAALYTGSRKS